MWRRAAPALVGLLGVDGGYGRLPGFPFIPFGIGAFLILVLLASISHDFWLTFLTPSVWKALHRLLYLAYLLVAAHLALGQIQDARNPLFPLIAFAAVTAVSLLHLAAAVRTLREDRLYARMLADDWIDAGAPEEFAESAARIIAVQDGEKVAIFRHEGRLSALSNVCAHQSGPLGEGRVVDGCAPPPFTEKLPTYALRLADGRVLLNPRANGRTIMMAGFGKSGVDLDPSFDGRSVKAGGFMVKRGALDMLQSSPDSFQIIEGRTSAPARPEPLGRWRVSGEICDGKCYAGVMRPGAGVAHKACASFCLLGGVRPVFVTTSPLAGHSFLLIAGPGNEPLPPNLVEVVGLRITLEGSVERVGDLLILHADPQSLKQP